MTIRNARCVVCGVLVTAFLVASPVSAADSDSDSYPYRDSELGSNPDPSAKSEEPGWDGVGWDSVDQGVPRVVFDIAVLRPLGLVQSVVGVAAFVIFYPVSLLTGGSDDVMRACITQPYDQTFRRSLGE